MNWEITTLGSFVRLYAVMPFSSPSDLLKACLRDDPVWDAKQSHRKPHIRPISNKDMWKKYPDVGVGRYEVRGEPLER